MGGIAFTQSLDHNLLEKDFCDLVASCSGQAYANTATKVENATQTPNLSA